MMMMNNDASTLAIRDDRKVRREKLCLISQEGVVVKRTVKKKTFGSVNAVMVVFAFLLFIAAFFSDFVVSGFHHTSLLQQGRRHSTVEHDDDKPAKVSFYPTTIHQQSFCSSPRRSFSSSSSSISLLSLLAKRGGGGGTKQKSSRGGGSGGKGGGGGGKTRSSSARTKNKNNNNHKHTKKKTTRKENSDNNPMNGSRNKAGGTTNSKQQQQQHQHTPPPWQVLSKKDAKKNIQLEKDRREKIQKGLMSPQDAEEDKLLEQAGGGGGGGGNHPMVVSKSFLSHYDKNFLGWKRFNPSTVPSGMRFVASVLDKRMPPRLGVPEIAFLGRSNVGKSSLLNRLSSFSKREAGFTDEARVGKTPGATASVNLYAFYDKKERPILGFVDLPGFGYAKLSKGVKESVQQTAEKYLGKRTELVLGILLVDIRRRPSEDDRIVLAALYDMGVPIVVVATKVDKVSKNEFDIRLEEIREGLGLPEGQPFCVSSVTGEGTKPLWNLIFEACEIGVEDFRKKFERGGSDDVDDEEDDNYEYDENDDGFYDDEVEESYYSQGYDWIQDAGRIQEHGRKSVFEYGGDNRAVEKEGDDDGFLDEYDNHEEDIAPFRESIKDLKKKARRLERGGGV